MVSDNVYYKHMGMVRFYKKFFRHQYPAAVMWLVMAGIAVRYSTKSLVVMITPKMKIGRTDSNREITEINAASVGWPKADRTCPSSPATALTKLSPYRTNAPEANLAKCNSPDGCRLGQPDDTGQEEDLSHQLSTQTVRLDNMGNQSFPNACPEPTESTEPAAPTRRAIVTGATSLIGDFLLPALVRSGFEVHAISRKPPIAGTCNRCVIVWHRQDIGNGGLRETYGADVLIHLAPLWALPPLLDRLAGSGIKRILAFSSTSLFTKEKSGSEQERQMVSKLKKAEEDLQSFCTERNISWTIFRPTLVYSLGRDKNVTTIARFIKRFRFFPLVGAGDGLRQPVHAEDLALACLDAIDNPKTFNKSYNLSGGEVLTYRDMVIRISGHLGTKCKIIHIPLPLMRFALGWLSNLPGYQKITPEAANRINLDMCFDHHNAVSDINFAPRYFLEY
ncbi:NAD-dependent epimerase/dehydratase family protein [Methylocaldum marinum]|uniref:NAD-dependent epimerase/dehydratase family protein n=1 Tax=Methylocaldum marinum TaxID=1432792 RepID=UPI0018D512DB|nr:NAD-dependent epimerase/dehydratase family protein [Methylocaldum marinum]